MYSVRDLEGIIKPGSVRAYIVAMVLVAIAVAARRLLGFAVHETIPFITFYPVVVFATLAGGAAVGVFSAVLGAAFAWWYFMPRDGNVFPFDLNSQAALAAYLVAALAIVWAADYARRLSKRVGQEESLRTLAVQELSHRLKNKVMTIQAVIAMRLQNHPAVRDEVHGALSALASADDLLTTSQQSGAGLHEILARETRAYSAERVAVSGPEVFLPPQIALMMALLIHELATNAAKYGAFSTPQGRVSVRWTLDAGKLDLVWQESGGPSVAPPARQGFGTRLFSRALAPFEGRADVDFAADGLVCKLSVPIERNP